MTAARRPSRLGGRRAQPAGRCLKGRDSATLEALPGKQPLIKLSYRPPTYEAPMEHFRAAITRVHDRGEVPAGRRR